jgi:nitrous oxidase accessory protein
MGRRLPHAGSRLATGSAMILPLLALLAGIAPGHTLHVGPTAIPTIGEAVRRSHPGDTVVVAAGVYREPTIVVDRRIVIFGVGWPVVDGQGRHQGHRSQGLRHR